MGPQENYGASSIFDHSVGDHSVGDHSVGDHSVGEHNVSDHSVSDQSLFLDWLSKIEKSNIIISQ